MATSDSKIRDGRLGLVIKDNRKQQGISQQVLAGCAKLTSEFICMIENERRIPSLGSLERIAACFGKTAADILKEVAHIGERLSLQLTLIEFSKTASLDQLKAVLEFHRKITACPQAS